MEIMMNTLLDNLADHLQGDTLTQLSRQVGADEEATASAIAAALPMLVGGLARNASTPAGASSLEQALDGDHDGSLLQNISALFGGGNAAPVSPRTLNGAGILEHIFGGRRAPAEQTIGKASGLNLQQAGRLMVMLAPLVMAYLGRRKREQGTQNLASLLRSEEEEIERRGPGLFGNLFGRKPKADFSDVRSGGSTTAGAQRPAATGQLETYTVVAGDSLSRIAQRRYGAASKWRVIFEANRDQIKDPDLIHPGQVLTIPQDR
jgi:uncharacterized protein YidB (DUF937 family)